MRIDRLTHKAQEALADARDYAGENAHAEVLPAHFLAALLMQEEGLIPRILSRIGVDGEAVYAALTKELESLHNVTGTSLDIRVSAALKSLWEAAFKEAEGFRDEFISTEHFFSRDALLTTRPAGKRRADIGRRDL